MSASLIKELIGQDIWDSYFKFCVVRNPYDKCISAFCHFGKDYQGENKLRLNNPQVKKMNAEQLRFLSYIQHKAPGDRDKYIINGEFCLDDVIRYESLEEDIKRISQRIGVPFANKQIPKFKSGIRGEDATIESLYTELAREAVGNRYVLDLKQFGYRFPNSTALQSHALGQQKAPLLRRSAFCCR